MSSVNHIIWPYTVNGELVVMILKHTHLFGTALLCGPAYPHQSKCFTKTIGTAPFCWEQASRSWHVGWFGGRADFLAEVRVQNNITAETLYGETLPAKTISSSDLDSGYSSCFSVIVVFYTVTNSRVEFKILNSPGKLFKALGNDEVVSWWYWWRFYSRLKWMDDCECVCVCLTECQSEIKRSSTSTGLFSRQYVATRLQV